MDEAYIKAAGQWKCPYHAMKKAGDTVEQDRQVVKLTTAPMLGFKSFWSAQKLIAGIETMHMIKRGKLPCTGCQPISIADQLYSLVC